jgi:hypothetical protein
VCRASNLRAFQRKIPRRASEGAGRKESARAFLSAGAFRCYPRVMASHTFTFRVRYARPTDGTSTTQGPSNGFEVARSELSRSLGVPYTEWGETGLLPPARGGARHLQGTARYDDLLEMTVTSSIAGTRAPALRIRDSSRCGAEEARRHRLHGAPGR